MSTIEGASAPADDICSFDGDVRLAAADAGSRVFAGQASDVDQRDPARLPPLDDI